MRLINRLIPQTFRNEWSDCSSNATNNLTSKKQKVCSLCYQHAETRRRKGSKRCDLFYGGECEVILLISTNTTADTKIVFCWWKFTQFNGVIVLLVSIVVSEEIDKRHYFWSRLSLNKEGRELKFNFKNHTWLQKYICFLNYSALGLSLSCTKWWVLFSGALRTVESLLQCHYTQVHSDSEGLYLLGSHLWIK